MKILVLTGSPHVRGTTALLADEFCLGAQEGEHEVTRFDICKTKVNSCLGCDFCQANEGKCVHNDGMTAIYPHLLEADAVALVTPLYYFGMTAQIKSAIDRFYAINNKLRSGAKKLYLLSACGDVDEWAMDSLKLHVETICKYLGWENQTNLFAQGCYERSDIEKTDFPEKARLMGQSI